MSWLAPGTRVHVVGVGGAGMGAVALLLAESGCEVSGSDASDSVGLDALRAAGVRVDVGHDAAHGSAATVVLWSPAVADDNVELVAARERGARLVSRAELVGELGDAYRVIGLTGTHGKTTATAMMAHVMAAAGRDAARLVGARVPGVGEGGHHGPDGLVLEVDESYGTFARLSPFSLGLLNVEPDHLDHYGSLEALEDAFAQLVARTSGPVAAWIDDPGALRAVELAGRDYESVGTGAGARWRVDDVRVARGGSRFTLNGPHDEVAVTLRVPGRHVVADAAVVAVLARLDGVAPDVIAAGLGAFAGVARRFERRGSWEGADVYEDYAHLPGEIRATLVALRDVGYRRVTAVFQPHRVTRTVALAGQFAPAFDDADHVIVTDLYPAGEANPTGVTGDAVAAPLRARRGDVVTYAPRFADVVATLERVRADSDVVVFLGAGDVARVVEDLPGGVT